MMIALLIAGIGAILAGLVAVVYGLLLELSFGNTLILAGAVAVCSGIIVLAQAVVVRELRNIAGRLGPRMAEEARPRPVLASAGPPAVPEAAEEEFQFLRDRGAPTAAEPAPSLSAATPPWREQGPLRDRARQEAPVPPPEEAEPAPPRRRNLLFSSTVRKDRERESAAPPPPPSEASEAAPPNVGMAWPRAERPRAFEPVPRRPGRVPPQPAEPAPETAEAARSAEPSEGEEQPAVTVIKSGVVDGMAYSLYSDGSIEAQMPEGLMRFASIDELRAHLDQRS
ncbi:DUF308 domain-containing protein [Bradyrhizobium sp. STM 3562]|uniref:DUF308 domain-containing protein n=1 Tax=Bradyrhizobium sp. STM 3562 TaxID=578924 RepID=UPI00388E1B69